MQVRAKFYCSYKIPGYGGQVTVGLSAVYSPNPESENKAFSDSTPSGQINIVIAPGKPALDAFEIGKEYFVDFTEAPKA
jgi:hypothetical protein